MTGVSPTTYVDSVVFFRTDKGAFPDPYWTDFTYPILSDWSENILRMHAEKKSKCELYFMDGPFLLEIKRKGSFYSVEGKSTLQKYKKYFQDSLKGNWKIYDSIKDFEDSFTFECMRNEFITELLNTYQKLLTIVFQDEKVPQDLRDAVKWGFDFYGERLRCLMQSADES